MMSEYETQKDKTAIGELRIVISELTALLFIGEKNIGTCRPIISASEIDLIKDHLDLVVKYTSLR
jgi:hypothetical protein